MKAVTGDPRHIEDVLKRVDALVKPIEEVPNYDYFPFFYAFCLVPCFVPVLILIYSDFSAPHSRTHARTPRGVSTV